MQPPFFGDQASLPPPNQTIGFCLERFAAQQRTFKCVALLALTHDGNIACTHTAETDQMAYMSSFLQSVLMQMLMNPTHAWKIADDGRIETLKSPEQDLPPQEGQDFGDDDET